MEELNEICEILMEKCACSWVRDQTNEAHDKYFDLINQIQGKISARFPKFKCYLSTNVL